MMIFNADDFLEVKKYFPNLALTHGEIHGEISFSAMYVQDKRGQWLIEVCDSTSKGICVTGDYKIKITLTKEGVPNVYETGNKISTLAKKLGLQISDLHVNSDKSCCLSFYINPKLTIKEFILNKVYPFFVWQAYYEKFEQVPPSGEYSHNIKAIPEFIEDCKKIGRNDICFCGSGKKYKKCCLH